ncbi:MAG: purine-nucleoside phosphorylase [Acidaminococcus sp.]|nr:purine-nucleoside phosphorylase [Acidaminococcus sp.]MDY4559768.1 purine-nucleoside phosphorylase [Eubacteriales bacterium]
MATPHINAKEGDFAKTVLMPGDPLRAKFIAETFLKNAELVNNVRGVQGYTGEYNGKRVSVMASGMGMPSMAIYSYELFKFFGVDTIIRIGSAGATSKDLKVRDIVIANSAYTTSSIIKEMGFDGNEPKADEKKVELAKSVAKKMGINAVVGKIMSSDVFYRTTDLEDMARRKVLAVEMEAAALFVNAINAKKSALALCTISDSLVTGESLSASDRQLTFTQMMEIALEMA